MWIELFKNSKRLCVRRNTMKNPIAISSVIQNVFMSQRAQLAIGIGGACPLVMLSTHRGYKHPFSACGLPMGKNGISNQSSHTRSQLTQKKIYNTRIDAMPDVFSSLCILEFSQRDSFVSCTRILWVLSQVDVTVDIRPNSVYWLVSAGNNDLCPFRGECIIAATSRQGSGWNGLPRSIETKQLQQRDSRQSWPTTSEFLVGLVCSAISRYFVVCFNPECY